MSCDSITTNISRRYYVTNNLTTSKGVSLAGIDFTYEHKAQCPSCASEGMDNSGDNLHVYGSTASIPGGCHSLAQYVLGFCQYPGSVSLPESTAISRAVLMVGMAY